MLLPFVYLLLGALASTFSLTGTIDLAAYRLTFANFATLFARAELYLPLINSIIVAVIVTRKSILLHTLRLCTGAAKVQSQEAADGDRL